MAHFSKLAGLLSSLMIASPLAMAQECGICAREVVVNSSLAGCFLEKYPTLAERGGAAVIVDLSDCESERGVVAALRGPASEPVPETSTRFMLTLPQLACLKARLETPGMTLDPSARIDLDQCQ